MDRGATGCWFCRFAIQVQVRLNRRSTREKGPALHGSATGFASCTAVRLASTYRAMQARDSRRRCQSRMTQPIDGATGAAPVTAVVADDEPIARAGLRDMLAEISWVRWIGDAASGPAAVEAIDRLRPDLVFLDIQMPGLLGTEVLRKITHQPYVVFTTAYAQHAVTGFELGALDYLLKPFGR